MFLHCLCFLTDLPLNLSRCSNSLSVCPLFWPSAAQSSLISKREVLSVKAACETFSNKGTDNAVTIPAQIIWQSPLFSIASARAEPQQNANMGESEAFLWITQPFARRNVKTAIVTRLGMDWAGGNAAWDPATPPQPTPKPRPMIITETSQCLRQPSGPSRPLFRGRLCRSGCKYEWTHQTLTLQGLAIIFWFSYDRC